MKKGAALWFLDKIVLPCDHNSCLIWPYTRNSMGYAMIWWEGKRELVSRVVCGKINGPPPSLEHVAAHDCGKGHLGCVNPNHLIWKTKTANMLDKFHHGTTKVNQDDIAFIQQNKGLMTQQSIADHLKISRSWVSMIQTETAFPKRNQK